MSDKQQERMNAPGATDDEIREVERALRRLSDRMSDAEWEQFKRYTRAMRRGRQPTVPAAGDYPAEAVIVFYKAFYQKADRSDYWRGLAALLENNFTVGKIDDDFLLRRGFAPEVVAEHAFDSAWVVAFTTTRLDRAAFIAWVRSIVGPFGGEVEDAGEIPCDLLDPSIVCNGDGAAQVTSRGKFAH